MAIQSRFLTIYSASVSGRLCSFITGEVLVDMMNEKVRMKQNKNLSVSHQVFVIVKLSLERLPFNFSGYL